MFAALQKPTNHSPTTTVRFRSSFIDQLTLSASFQVGLEIIIDCAQTEEATTGFTGVENEHARDWLGEAEKRDQCCRDC